MDENNIQHQQENGFAIAGMVVGIIAICVCGGYFVNDITSVIVAAVASIVGLVLSYIGLKNSTQTGIGKNQAKTGLILSIIAVLVVISLIIVVATGHPLRGDYNYNYEAQSLLYLF
ncbi:MAG: hypothetical protein FWF56_06870 [Firmicutes bacterium]|nr:hypothetical protein [Bacillota bacterium]